MDKFENDLRIKKLYDEHLKLEEEGSDFYIVGFSEYLDLIVSVEARSLSELWFKLAAIGEIDYESYQRDCRCSGRVENTLGGIEIVKAPTDYIEALSKYLRRDGNFYSKIARYIDPESQVRLDIILYAYGTLTDNTKTPANQRHAIEGVMDDLMAHYRKYSEIDKELSSKVKAEILKAAVYAETKMVERSLLKRLNQILKYT